MIMKRSFKKLFLTIFMVAVFLLFIRSLPKYHKIFKFEPGKKTFINNIDDSNSINALCHKNNFSVADTVAFHYMRGLKGRIECDILNGSYFVQITDHFLYDPEKHSVDFDLLRTLQSQRLLNETDSNLNLNEPFYSMRLNIDGLVEKLKLSKKKFNCIAELFDKVFNVSENFNIEILDRRIFSKKYDYTLYFKKHGYYHVNCYNSTNTSARIYDDSFLILPRNMSILVEERKYYKSLEIKESKLSNDGDEEEIKFLKEDNTLKIDKKMNVLMTGFDSLSYQHFQRV